MNGQFTPEATVNLEWDSLLSDIFQGDKTLKRYSLKMGTDVEYDSESHLSITAFAESYDSDPDIFINKRVSFNITHLSHFILLAR